MLSEADLKLKQELKKKNQMMKPNHNFSGEEKPDLTGEAYTC